ncbi:myo-inositol 2-dehydrogenase/D-chiro-inositol 1-dehydrogenase [Saccharothrix tamanrassetensis]|uniref:Myo-inositol 2-dehydrogenase/D-chiro-inositol 1-dehydrogenase n=1 Tax=Saccharothrix tamanrassetensis TaxID=1051531 RepID=A0A841CEZ5_9PSEU|nr:Gfo/Idh/MocA family oxidoreductase [Saccharothrix tamanrassetensis]MBB5954585.1 myo-inositol 2-dehydrogenase/D-chiro-inositol 1-dehydrogenase [Saccharothrix tamanrassetensis]
MRIGVAGVGRIGTMHATNLASLDRVDEVLLFDPVPGRAARASAGLPGTRSVDDLTELLTASDGVLLATPTATHPALLREAIAAGVPTLCEKPVASDLDEMRALVAEVERSGVEVLVGFQRRFDPAVSELHRRVRAGEVGDIYLVRALGNDAQPPDFSYLPHSGGIFRDLLIHDLDAVPWLVGEPVVEVYASGSVLVHQAFADADDVDNAVVLLRFAGGAHATLAGGRHDPLGYDHRIEVLGSKDSLTVGLDPRTPLTSLEPDGPRVGDAYPGFPERFHRAYLNEMAVFVDVVAGGVANPSPARESLVSLRLAEACERSRRSGAPVRILEVTA